MIPIQQIMKECLMPRGPNYKRLMSMEKEYHEEVQLEYRNISKRLSRSKDRRGRRVVGLRDEESE